MHIHPNFAIQAANSDDPNSQRAERAERAAQTRRKLHKAAQSIDATDLESADTDADALVSNWLSVNHNQSLADDRYVPGPAHRDPFPR